jgi:hypothetical protein
MYPQIINIKISRSCKYEKVSFVILTNRFTIAFIGNTIRNTALGNKNTRIIGNKKIIEPKKTLARNLLNESAPAVNPIPNRVNITDDNITPGRIRKYPLNDQSGIIHIRELTITLKIVIEITFENKY